MRPRNSRLLRSQFGFVKILGQQVQIHHGHRILILFRRIIVNADDFIFMIQEDGNALNAGINIHVLQTDFIFIIPGQAFEEGLVFRQIAQFQRLGEGMKVNGDIMNRGVIGQAHDVGHPGMVFFPAGLDDPVAGEDPAMRIDILMAGGVRTDKTCPVVTRLRRDVLSVISLRWPCGPFIDR